MGDDCKMKLSGFKLIENTKDIDDKDSKIETSNIPDLEIGIDISVEAVNEYAKTILGRYPKNNIEFSTALQSKILEESKTLMSAFKE